MAVAIGVFLYFRGQDRTSLTYLVETEASPVFDAEAAAPSLIVLRPDSVAIDSTVYITRVLVWNSGNQAINQGDIRESVRLLISPIDEIIAANVEKSKRRVDRVRVDETRLAESVGQIYLNWDYMDPGGDGSAFVVSILHTGKAERMQVDVAGVGLNMAINNYGIRIKRDDLITVIMILPTGLFGLYVGYSGIMDTRDMKPRSASKYAKILGMIFICLSSIAFIIFSAVVLYQLYNVSIPDL